MEDVKVVLWGLGAMGGGIGQTLLAREGVQIVGAIDHNPSRVGKKLEEALGVDKATDVTVVANEDEVLRPGAADLAFIATASFTREVYPQIRKAVECGLNVITIAEEMAYPAAAEPELARELDELAKRHGVTILGTGINPGFVLDTLIVALTGVCLKIDSIRAVRVNDLSPFGPTVMRTQGVGTTPEAFEQGIADGTIVGHVGFPESMNLIAKALGWELDEIIETKEPIVSKVYRETQHVAVEPGMVAGCKHIAYGKKGGKTLITLEHPQQVKPELEQVETGDYVYIEGTPGINLAIQPEIPGGIGTIAMAVNMVPQVLQAQPGLTTMNDLPIPAAVLQDLKRHLA